MSTLSKIKRLRDVYSLFRKSDKEVVEMLEDEGLLQKLKKCPKCRNMQSLNKHADFKGGYAMYCKKCKKFKNITQGTFFETTKVDFEDFFAMMWLWARNASVKVTMNIGGFTKALVVQYFRYFRDVCSWKLLTMEEQTLGGEGHLVQIDESVVAKRKYNRGKKVKTTWVLGMIDTETRQSVILYVEKRDKCTLIPEIKRHVKPGTELWTDGWAAYKGLDKEGFIHRTVNHSKEFKSAEGVCTNLIEGHWNTLKRFCRGKNVMNSKHFFEYVDEFLWSERFGKDCHSRFVNLIQHIEEKYPC